MRAAQRDQTETREAIKEFETFVDAVSEQQADAGSEGAAARGAGSARARPTTWSATSTSGSAGIRAPSIGFRRCSRTTRSSRSRDAAYFYLAESLIKVKREAEALPYYEKLVQEFEKSEFLPEAQKRIAELKAQVAKTPPPAK